MDVSFYISELLEQHGEISVPGLGYLVLARVSGYYNEAEGKYYPPHHLIQFDPQQIDDDDTLTQYIADIKNISLASSKYFTEKYITHIREESLVKEIAVGNLGFFHTEEGRLNFKAGDVTETDPAFFGLPPVIINKLGGQLPAVEKTYASSSPFNVSSVPSPLPPAPPHEHEIYIPSNMRISNEPVSDEPYEVPAPHREADGEEEYEDDSFKRTKALLIAAIVLIILGLGAFGMYRYAPDKVNKAKDWVHNILHPVKNDPALAAPKKDTTIQPVMPALGDTSRKRDTVKTDTISKTTKPVTPGKKAETGKKVTATKVETKVITTAVVEPPKQKAVEKLKVTDTKADKKPADSYTKPAIADTKVIDKRVIVTPVTPPVEVKKTKPAVTTTLTTTADIPAGAHWMVIAIVCSTQAKADAIVSKYKQDGLNAFIVPSHGAMIKVAAGAYATNDEADAARVKLSSTNKIPKDAYIQEIKSNR